MANLGRFGRTERAKRHHDVGRRVDYLVRPNPTGLNKGIYMFYPVYLGVPKKQKRSIKQKCRSALASATASLIGADDAARWAAVGPPSNDLGYRQA